jgi:hypothetical protein
LLKWETMRHKNNLVRCPYCVKGSEFNGMARQTDGDWLICASCGHLALPSSPLFECTCANCERLRLKHQNLKHQKKRPTLRREIKKRLRDLIGLMKE